MMLRDFFYLSLLGLVLSAEDLTNETNNDPEGMARSSGYIGPGYIAEDYPSFGHRILNSPGTGSWPGGYGPVLDYETEPYHVDPVKIPGSPASPVEHEGNSATNETRPDQDLNENISQKFGYVRPRVPSYQDYAPLAHDGYYSLPQSYGSYSGPQSYGPYSGAQSYGPYSGAQSYGPYSGAQSYGPYSGPQSYGPYSGPQSYGPYSGPQSYGPYSQHQSSEYDSSADSLGHFEESDESRNLGSEEDLDENDENSIGTENLSAEEPQGLHEFDGNCFGPNCNSAPYVSYGSEEHYGPNFLAPHYNPRVVPAYGARIPSDAYGLNRNYRFGRTRLGGYGRYRGYGYPSRGFEGRAFGRYGNFDGYGYFNGGYGGRKYVNRGFDGRGYGGRAYGFGNRGSGGRFSTGYRAVPGLYGNGYGQRRPSSFIY